MVKGLCYVSKVLLEPRHIVSSARAVHYDLDSNSVRPRRHSIALVDVYQKHCALHALGGLHFAVTYKRVAQ